MNTAHHTATLPFYRLAQPLSKEAHVARVKSALLSEAHNILEAESFTQVVPTTLTDMAGACGDPGTLIKVDLQGCQGYLRQTSQLHLEPLMRELGRVYSVSKSFRNERRKDERHLTEFTLVEAEAAGWDLYRMMALMERLVKGMLRHAHEVAAANISALGAGLYIFDSTPFARITYDEAIITLQKNGHFIEWGEDLSAEHELILTGIYGPLFVTHYPVGLRFFTMKVSRDDPRVVQCCDLLLPGVGEVMGASETENDPALLEHKLQTSPSIMQTLDLGGSAADYAWYIEMHNRASELQAGFGMGFERLVRYACGLTTVAWLVL
ncbi:MAG: hypothetical protein M3014_10950 [Chloroflexota bacterium]|nr:hypothetical protein [Chloroflexota bacterium]